VQLPARRPADCSAKRLAKRHKSVNRAYGGHLCHGVVRERIIRAFLIEEQKIVKKVRHAAGYFVVFQGSWTTASTASSLNEAVCSFKVPSTHEHMRPLCCLGCGLIVSDAGWQHQQRLE
jgi:hypothetical protein